MKVVSWNILANEFIKKSYYPTIKSKMLFDRKGRLAHITIILKNVDADVMLLQEVMGAEYNSLYETFDKDYYIIQGDSINWSNKKTYSGNVTFLRKGVFFLSANTENAVINYLPFGIYVKCYFLDVRDNERDNIKNNNVKNPGCENMCTVTSALPYQGKVNKNDGDKLRSNDKLTPIDIINVHLDYNSHSKRIAEIKSIESVITKTKRVILGGDFNQDYKPNSKLYKLLNQAMRLKMYIKDPTYFVEKEICIDHIMTKGIYGGIYGNSCGCVVNNYGDDFLQQFTDYGSDHLPIIAKI